MRFGSAESCIENGKRTAFVVRVSPQIKSASPMIEAKHSQRGDLRGELLSL